MCCDCIPRNPALSPSWDCCCLARWEKFYYLLHLISSLAYQPGRPGVVRWWSVAAGRAGRAGAAAGPAGRRPGWRRQRHPLHTTTHLQTTGSGICFAVLSQMRIRSDGGAREGSRGRKLLSPHCLQ